METETTTTTGTTTTTTLRTPLEELLLLEMVSGVPFAPLFFESRLDLDELTSSFPSSLLLDTAAAVGTSAAAGSSAAEGSSAAQGNAG